jgi:hypothetical protein
MKKQENALEHSNGALLIAVVLQVFREVSYNNGAFRLHWLHGNWWSSTENNTSHAWYRTCITIAAVYTETTTIRFRFSVRCLRD